MNFNEYLPVALTVASRWLPIFGALLSRGFRVKVETGVSLRDVLCTQLGVEQAYLENRIKTVFLNSQAVDDVNQAVVKKGAVVALSAAMPGLVGAVMRRGGFYAGLRSSISYRAEGGRVAAAPGTIQLKLFNLVAKELGPHFLARGIEIDSIDWQAFLSGQAEDFQQGITAARVGGQSIDPLDLFTRPWPTGDVNLLVTVA